MSRKKTSIVWRHFTLIEKNDVRCSLCFSVLKFSCGSTHNLIRHLRFKHKEVFADSNTYSESVTEEIVKPEDEQVDVIEEQSEIEVSDNCKPEFEETHIDESDIAHSEEVQSEIQTEEIEFVSTEVVPDLIVPKMKSLKKPAPSVTLSSPKRCKVFTHKPEETRHQKQPDVRVIWRPAEGVKPVLSQEENEFDAYGRIVALQLKQMPLKEALLAQQLIHGILRKQRIKVINREHYKNCRTTSNWDHGDHTYLQSSCGSPDDDDSDDL